MATVDLKDLATIENLTDQVSSIVKKLAWQQQAREDAYAILVQQNAALIRRVKRYEEGLSAIINTSQRECTNDLLSGGKCSCGPCIAREALKEEPDSGS